MISDARVRYTRMVIKNSFIQMLQKQPVNKITVKDVCELAEINRATFYKHYMDCFDLLKKIEDEMIAELQRFIQESQHKNSTDMFKKIFNKIKEDSDLYIIIASENGDTTFPNQILNLCYKQMNASFESLFPDITKTKQEWLYFFSASGCSGILNHWINTGMKEDVTELSEFMGDLLNKISDGFRQSTHRTT
jgi:AcrR family transcriptional regulator